MNYTDYLAQQPQEPQEPQEEPQANRLDMMRAQLDAGKYYSLLAEAREVIAEAAEQAARHERPYLPMILEKITAAIFGHGSPEADSMAEIITMARYAGGYEYAIEQAKQRRRLYKKQLERLAEVQKELAEQAELALAEERELSDSKLTEEKTDRAFLEIMEFSRQLDTETDPAAMIRQAGQLYERYSGSRAAMGLLLGSLTEWQGRAFTFTGGVTLDLVQQQEMQELKSRLAAAAGQ